MSPKPFRYIPDGKVLADFFWSYAPVQIIQGPVGCLSAETEFLTPWGWKRIDAYEPGDRLMAWKDGDAWFEEPINYIDKPCEEMWRFRSEHALSMMLSDEHRVPLYDRKGDLRVRLAADVAKAPGRYTVPINFRTKHAPFDEWELRLRVAVAADGCLPKRGNQVIITVRKDRKKQRIRELLFKTQIPYKEYDHSTRDTETSFAFERQDWMQKTLDLIGCGSARCEVVLDEIKHWDGLYEGEDARWTGTCRRTADFIQYAAHATGRRATISTYDDPRNAEWSTLYAVHITGKGSPKTKVGMRGDHVEISRVPAPGDRKYCFTTSTGFFLARHNGRIFVTGNSGTSTACCHKLWRMACEQRPDRSGVRRSRWVIVRNTFNDLKETTLKTWKYWFEQIAAGSMGEVKMTNPPHHDINIYLPDKTQVQAEFIFLALDQEDDVRKLLSMEMTGIWFNEAQFTEKAIFDAAHSRAAQGRYPPKLDGGPSWKGVICDLNAPPEGHWIPYMRGDVPMPDEWTDEERRAHEKPEGWKFFIQPAGLIEQIEDGRVVDYIENNRENREKLALDPVDEVAENMKWIDVSYRELIHAKNKTWIDTFVMNRVGLYRAGQPVYTGFREEVHVAKDPIEYNPHLPLIVGLDFARNPAMICIQVLRGRVFVLDEFGVKNESATKYAPLFKQRLAKVFPLAMAKGGKGIQFWGDPTGGSKGQGTDNTPFSIFATNGMRVAPAPGNNSITLRTAAVQAQLDKMVDGSPGLLVDPRCITLKGGFNGGYHFARIKGTSAFHEEPNKRVTYADYHDALQYACLGAGMGISAVHGTGIPKPVKMRERKKFSLVR